MKGNGIMKLEKNQKQYKINMTHIMRLFTTFILISTFLTINFSYPVYSQEALSISCTKHETEHFEIFYPRSEEKMISEILPKLEKNYETVLSHLGTKPLNKRIFVKIYPSLKEFHEAIGWTDAPNWISGRFANGVIEVAVPNSGIDRAITLITHEMTHIISKTLNPGFVPAILFEGIATYEAGQSYLKSELKDLEILPTVDELFSMHQGNKFLYPLSYSFVKFIIENGGYSKIIELLKVNYQKNEFEFDSIKDIYEAWTESVLL